MEEFNAGADRPARAYSRDPQASLRFIYFSDRQPLKGRESALQKYARVCATLMGARLSRIPAPAGVQEASAPDGATWRDCDLLLLADMPPLQLVRGAADQTLPSLLIARQFVWPLRRILMLMRAEATDRATVEWGLRLARATSSRVTLLVVLPPSEWRQERGDTRLADVLARHTVTGRYVRHVLERLVSLDIEAVLRLRQGALAGQVRQEVQSGDYDLIVTSAEPPGRLLSSHLERLIEPLLQWTSAPLLVARLPEAWTEQAPDEESL